MTVAVEHAAFELVDCQESAHRLLEMLNEWASGGEIQAGDKHYLFLFEENNNRKRKDQVLKGFSS